MKKINRIVFNSFQRSGNIYCGSVSERLFHVDTIYTTHLPEIFIVKDLALVSIFRKPEDCIPSLIYKYYPNRDISEEGIHSQIKKMISEYKEYIEGAKNNSDHVYIANFNSIVNNTLENFIKIGKMFDLTMKNDYESSFKSMKLTGTLWTDLHEGHLPREKDDYRLLLDKIAKDSSEVQILNKEYEDFINQYDTFKIV